MGIVAHWGERRRESSATGCDRPDDWARAIPSIQIWWATLAIVSCTTAAGVAPGDWAWGGGAKDLSTAGRPCALRRPRRMPALRPSEPGRQRAAAQLLIHLEGNSRPRALPA